jgi:hypothetical protein
MGSALWHHLVNYRNLVQHMRSLYSHPNFQHSRSGSTANQRTTLNLNDASPSKSKFNCFFFSFARLYEEL